MNNINWQTVETIVDEALELPEQERKKFIDKRCGDNEQLKGEVTLLLESIHDSKGWLENFEPYKAEFYKEISDDLEAETTNHSLIGQNIGSYTITEQIGEGGMGVVYLADRTEDEFNHRVAIKIIRRELASEENINRFKREKRILAGLNHPGIAQLFDGGVTTDGYPYIIMEYVQGTPINTYCQKHDCSIDKKIDLFKQVLGAIRHAHENLVIHRDLKPTNILVTGEGNVKILDFGISKLLDDEQSDYTLTKTGSRLLTPKYAAPEQIQEGNITMATDLYALGILFYELLVGEVPFNLVDAPSYEVEKTIIEKEPPKPSSKAKSQSLKQQLLGDLDAITLKAIRKEADRRYRVANDFLNDLNNYRKGLPVTARDDSFQYRTEKFFKRNKKALAVVSGIFLLILGFAGFYTWRIAQERDMAKLQAERAEEITGVLVSILQMNNPRENAGKEITVNEALLNGLDYLNKQNISAHNKAVILGAIGSIQINTGDINQAGLTLEKAFTLVTDSLSEQTPQTLEVGTSYAEWNATVGNSEKAEQYYQVVDSLFKKNKHTDSDGYVVHQINYSGFLNQHGKYHEALQKLNGLEKRIKTTSSASESKLNLSYIYNNRAIAFRNLAQYQKSYQNYEKALSIKRELYDSTSSEIGLIYHNMAVLLIDTEEYQDALELEKKAYKIRKQTLGKDHQLLGSSLHTLSVISKRLEQYEKALSYERKAIEVLKKAHGPTHYRYAMANRNLAEILMKVGKLTEAKINLDHAGEVISDNYGIESTLYGYIATSYINLYKAMEKKEALEKYYDLSLKIFSSLGQAHPTVAKLKNNYAEFEIKRSNYKKASKILEANLSALKNDPSMNNKQISVADSLFAICSQALSSDSSE